MGDSVDASVTRNAGSTDIVDLAGHYTFTCYDKDGNIKWVFDSSPSLDDIELEIRAYVELYGHAPELIVIKCDNLIYYGLIAYHNTELFCMLLM